MKETVDKKARRTATVPAAIVEEELLLSQEERTDVDSLKAAQARIAAGQSVEYDPA